ncbi:Hydrolase tropI [Golovinomyces cichoracearum]|uniref:Hydrolase tropI n=1 Tax=Golovinomyces cichoracearum TaxID=62708 RepID=A0A420HBF9_9PEZI|nr:Hydrolase tropI [Golovinomyces cichoracearum]
MAGLESATQKLQSYTSDSPNFVEESIGQSEFAPQDVSAYGIGEHCITDRTTPISQGPRGKISKLRGVDVYVTKPVDEPKTPIKFLLFLTGATGLHSVNNQIQADKFADEGFLVVLPDMFPNDPLPGTATYQEENDPTIIEQMKLRIAETVKSFLIDMWLARQTPEKVIPIISKVIEAAKTEFSDVIANGEGIYSVGYCFGGRLILLLAKEGSNYLTPNSRTQRPEDEESSLGDRSPLIKTGAICHATQVAKADFENVKSPLCFICVENDQLFPEEVRMYGEQSLKFDKVDFEFKTYTGVPHGFAVVGEYEDEKVKAAQEEAFNQILSWLRRN